MTSEPRQSRSIVCPLPNGPAQAAWFAIALIVWMATSVFSTHAAGVDFGRDVLPILSENCFQCHGPDAAARKAKLRLDTPESAPDYSELIGRVSSEDPELRMPPPKTGKQLTDGEVAILRTWIQHGATYTGHWAFAPIRQPKPPDVPNVQSDVDRFIIAALQARDLSLSPPLSRVALIRRATFDLCGLPPTWSDVEAFLSDTRPDAFARVVDRLLNSPAYGERWGRHWLDLARYADTHGGSAIGFTRFPFSYTYRDYVIAAFNADLPYDRFILEQLAADQLGLDPNARALAALGFLTVGRQFRNRHDRLDDQIDVITRGLLGLTVSCARCHDHKFDPIPTTDYYSLHATLASSRSPGELPLIGRPDIAPQYQAQLEARKRKRDDVIREQGEVMRGRLRMQVGLYLKELAKGTPEQDTATSFLSYRTEDLRPVVLERWRAYLKQMDENDPVFGPWHRLAKLSGDATFTDACQSLVQALKKENGAPKTFANQQNLKTKAPKWNPLVLDALDKGAPVSFVAVAEIYGAVFAAAQRRWWSSLLEAAAEAEPGGKVVPDEDARHRVVNSAVERQLRHHLYAPGSPTALVFKNKAELGMLNRGVRDAVRGTLSAIDDLNRTPQAPPRSMVLQESPSEDRAYVFVRGNPLNRGTAVEPRFLSILSDNGAPPFADGQRRHDLARAIVNPANPLTRRVIVNWIWQHHFGHGLVRTPDDFGTRGKPPSHPELLDYLANKLLEDGWSLKKLHRRIMLTDTYRQAAREDRHAREADPENALLWRMPTHKLSMEAMRDAMLAVSGELKFDPRPGGRPYDSNKFVPRRTVYAFLNRDVISKLAGTFDGADPSACTMKRPATMVPQQTLFALNSDFIQDRAKALVGLPGFRQAESIEDRVQWIYRRVYGRMALADEVETATQFLAGKETAWPQFVHALLAANEFHFVD